MKRVFIFVIMLFLVHYSQAQDDKLQIGIEGGPNAASQRGGFQNNNQKTLWGFSAAFSAQYKVTLNFSIRSGIGFEEKGYSTSEPFTTIINPQTGAMGTNGVINTYMPMDY